MHVRLSFLGLMRESSRAASQCRCGQSPSPGESSSQRSVKMSSTGQTSGTQRLRLPQAETQPGKAKAQADLVFMVGALHRGRSWDAGQDAHVNLDLEVSLFGAW